MGEPIFLGGASSRPFCEPAAWEPGAFEDGRPAARIRTALIKLLSGGPPRQVSIDDLYPANLYLRYLLDPNDVSLQTLRAVALTHRLWARWVRQLLWSDEFGAFWRRVLCGLLPESVLHPELATKERLKRWLMRADEHEHLHMARLAALFAEFCNIHPQQPASNSPPDFRRMAQAQGVDYEDWDGLCFDPCLEEGGLTERERTLDQKEPYCQGVTLLGTRLCYSIREYIEWASMPYSPDGHIHSAKVTLRWLHEFLGIRLGGAFGILGRWRYGLDSYTCSRSANRKLQAALRDYAPLFPDVTDRDGAALDPSSVPPDDADSDDEQPAQPVLRRVHCRLDDLDHDDPWTRSRPVAGKPWLGGGGGGWQHSPYDQPRSRAAAAAVEESDEEEGESEGEVEGEGEGEGEDDQGLSADEDEGC